MELLCAGNIPIPAGVEFLSVSQSADIVDVHRVYTLFEYDVCVKELFMCIPPFFGKVLPSPGDLLSISTPYQQHKNHGQDRVERGRKREHTILLFV
jgi:hypothetical protein